MSVELFLTAFTNGFHNAALANLGSVWELRAIPGPEVEDDSMPREGTLVPVINFCGVLEGKLYICPDEAASASVLPREEALPSGEIPSAWCSLLQSFAKEIGQALTEQFGGVQWESCSPQQIGRDVRLVGILSLSREQTVAGMVSFLGDTELLASVEANAHAGSAAEGLFLRGAEPNTGATFERVIDVPLAVKLRFGKRQLTLRELLELNTGSLVELDRQVEEPVDLVLGERLIARGEVVIVDGNYGMRVTEVIEQPSRRAIELD